MMEIFNGFVTIKDNLMWLVNAFFFQDLQSFLINLLIGLTTLLLAVFYLYFWKKYYTVNKLNVTDSIKPRFRKREKILFYGRRILRRVSSFAKASNSMPLASRRGRESRRKRLVMNIARKLLRLKKEQGPQWRAREPPASLLEVQSQENEFEHGLPDEIIYLLRNVRVLGHFEKPIFLELCRFMESSFLATNEYLFKIGDPDENIYVVQNGKIHLYATEPDGKEYCIKVVTQAESVHSLLSILDILTGHPAPYKSVSAVAMEDTTVLKLPAKAFQVVLDRYPDSMVRAVQMIMIRLQRVTFTTMYNYLGLSQELISIDHAKEKLAFIRNTSLIESTDGSNISKSQETRGTPAGAEANNQTAPSVPVSPPINDLPSPSHRKSSFKRKTSEWSSRVKSDGPGVSSDFDVACSRARADDATTTAKNEPGGCGLESKNKDKNIINSSATKSSSKPVTTQTKLDENQVFDLAVQNISNLFGVKNLTLLRNACEIKYIRSNTKIVSEGDQDCNLYFVMSGTLIVQQKIDSSERTLYTVEKGEVVGMLAVLTGEPSFFSIKTITDVSLILILKSNFYSLLKKNPHMVLAAGHEVVRKMSPFVRQIDFALDWLLISAGRALYRQGENSDCMYIILNGRLRSIHQAENGKKEIVEEFGRGELVGLVEVLTQTKRSTTLMAVRDTELAQIPDDLLNLIKRKYPQVVTRLIHLLGQRLLGAINKSSVQSNIPQHMDIDIRPTVSNLSTVAILSINEKVPLSNFIIQLQHSLQSIGPVLHLNCDIVKKKKVPTATLR